MIKLTSSLKSVIFGLLLSDGWLAYASKTSKNARLGFMQSYNHSEYLWFVFFMLSHYCSSYPLFRKRTRFGKVGYSLEFTTRSLPCLTELFYLFYPRGTGIKIIPENIYCSRSCYIGRWSSVTPWVSFYVLILIPYQILYV